MFSKELNFSEETVFTNPITDEADERKRGPNMAGISALLKNAIRNPNSFTFIPVKGGESILIFEVCGNGFTSSEYITSDEFFIALLTLEGLGSRIIDPMTPQQISDSPYRTTE